MKTRQPLFAAWSHRVTERAHARFCAVLHDFQWVFIVHPATMIRLRKESRAVDHCRLVAKERRRSLVRSNPHVVVIKINYLFGLSRQALMLNIVPRHELRSRSAVT